jgi:hypothetical protein
MPFSQDLTNTNSFWINAMQWYKVKKLTPGTRIENFIEKSMSGPQNDTIFRNFQFVDI